MSGDPIFHPVYMFFCGFLACWEILGIWALLGNTLDWERYDVFWIVLCFPVMLVVAPGLYLWYGLFWGPWRNVIHPVSPAKWRLETEDGVLKHFRIVGSLYFCHDTKAVHFYNRFFFARVAKEE